MHHNPKKTSPRSNACAFNLKNTRANVCNCSGANALNEPGAFRTLKGARKKRAQRVHMAHATSITKAASNGTRLFTGLNSRWNRIAHTIWNGMDMKASTTPNRYKD